MEKKMKVVEQMKKNIGDAKNKQILDKGKAINKKLSEKKKK